MIIIGCENKQEIAKEKAKERFEYLQDSVQWLISHDGSSTIAIDCGRTKDLKCCGNTIVPISEMPYGIYKSTLTVTDSDNDTIYIGSNIIMIDNSQLK
jgi:hypothetical protein